MKSLWPTIQAWTIWKKPWLLVRIVISTFPAFLAIWLLNQNYVLWPTVTHTLRPGHQPNRIFYVERDENLVGFRQARDGQWQWELHQGLTNFRLRLPRFVPSADVTFRLNAAAPVMTASFGPVSNQSTKLLYHQQLNELSWSHFRDRGLTVWQQPNALPAASISDVYKRVDQKNKIGLVGLDRFAFLRLGTNGLPTTSRISHVLRGPHEMYIYVSNPALTLNFSLIDLNRRSGRDPLTVQLTPTDTIRTTGRVPVMVKKVADDGITNSKKIIGSSRQISVTAHNLSVGIYRLDFQATDELLLSDITINQPYLNIINHLWLADGYKGSTNVAARVALEANQATITGPSAASYQTIQYGKTKLVVDAKHPKGTLTGLRATEPLTISHSDLKISAGGLLAIDTNSMLPTNGPVALPLDQIATPTKYDYVIADYEPEVKAWPRDFVITIPREKMVLNGSDLVISLWVGDDRLARQVRLRSATATFHRGPFPWDKISGRLRRFFGSS